MYIHYTMTYYDLTIVIKVPVLGAVFNLGELGGPRPQRLLLLYIYIYIYTYVYYY